MDWQTAHKDHAIERVALSFSFSEPVPTRPWQSILENVSKASAQAGFDSAPLPEEMALAPGAPQIFQIQIGVRGAAGIPTAGPGGKLFTRTTGENASEQLAVNRSQINYATTRYDGWDAFREHSISTMKDCMGEALPLVPLRSVRLEYWDRFVYHGAVGANYAEIFRDGSRHVPRFPFGTEELWHTHIGYFTRASYALRRLINVNLDMLDLAQPEIAAASDAAEMVMRRSAGIYSMAEDQFESEKSPRDIAEAMRAIEEMHSELKAVFSDLVTDSVGAKIGLHKSGKSK